MTMVQATVRQGVTEMTTWLPKDKRVKVGTGLTLDEEEGSWQAKAIHPEVPIELNSINCGWNNNI